MKNLFKVSALILGLVLTQAASAAIVTTTPNGSTLEAEDTVSFISSIAANTEFSDTFNFNLAGFSKLTGTVTGTFSNPQKEFSSFKAVLYTALDVLVADFSASTSDETLNGSIKLDSLSPSTSYKLVVTGKSGTLKTAYSGSLSVSPVPEAEEWAMMMLGLPLMGFVARRKKSSDSNSFQAVAA